MKVTFERVAGPYGRPLGGLAWDGGGMLFADIMESCILRYDPRRNTTTLWRNYTNRTNGIAFGRDGALFGCQEGSRRIVRYEPDGSTTLTTQHMKDGRVHNHPCALALDRQGRVWFSDPYNALAAWGPQLFGKLDHASVLRLDQDPAPQRRSWTIERVTRDTKNPRGIAFSPDCKTLYVCENDMAAEGRRELRAYPVADDGSVGQARVLHTFGDDYRGVHRGAEGVCVDADGNVWVVGGWRRSGPGPRLYVFDATGALVASYAIPADSPNACAFGGVALTSLYVTTGDGCLYRADRVGARGIRGR